jgi:hypothetical protein
MQDQAEASRVGDLIWVRATAHAAYLNRSEFLTSLRTRALSRERFVRHISVMYPVVVGFNAALIRSLSKLDNVRSAPLVKGLAEQLLEEQMHNDMWRAMLKSFDVDHLSVYSHLQEYLSSFSRDCLDGMTRKVISALAVNREHVSPGYFPTPVFPEPVLALFHHMLMVATCESFNFWCHFASQSALEATIYHIVSESYYPGTAGHRELGPTPDSTSWWSEHSNYVRNGESRSTEEKHMQIAKLTLNRARVANAHSDELLVVVEESLLLFSAAIICHNHAQP